MPEESVAVLDTISIPDSWYNVTKDKNDRIYVGKEDFSGGPARRIATIAPLYFDVNSLAPALAAALNTGRLAISEYTATDNTTLGRYCVKQCQDKGNDT